MTIRPTVCASTLVTVLAAVLAAGCAPPSTEPAPTNTGTAAETAEPTPQTSGSGPGCGPPTLRVSSPRDGGRVTAPFPITYEVRCFSVGRDGTIYFTAGGIRMDLHPEESAGTVTVADHPLQSGRRAVTIQLADTNGRALDNPEATVVMTIVIEGSRSAG